MIEVFDGEICLVCCLSNLLIRKFVYNILSEPRLQEDESRISHYKNESNFPQHQYSFK